MSDADQAHFPDFGKLVPGFDFFEKSQRPSCCQRPPCYAGHGAVRRLGCADLEC